MVLTRDRVGSRADVHEHVDVGRVGVGVLQCRGVRHAARDRRRTGRLPRGSACCECRSRSRGDVRQYRRVVRSTPARAADRRDGRARTRSRICRFDTRCSGTNDPVPDNETATSVPNAEKIDEGMRPSSAIGVELPPRAKHTPHGVRQRPWTSHDPAIARRGTVGGSVAPVIRVRLASRGSG